MVVIIINLYFCGNNILLYACNNLQRILELEGQTLRKMYSSSSCRGSRAGYIHYEVHVNCPSGGRIGHIKLSRSRDNPGRIFYKCTQCGKFIK